MPAGHGIGPSPPAAMTYSVDPAQYPGQGYTTHQPAYPHMGLWPVAAITVPVYQHMEQGTLQGFDHPHSLGISAAPAQHRAALPHAFPGRRVGHPPEFGLNFGVGGFATQPWWWQQHQLDSRPPQQMTVGHAAPPSGSVAVGSQPGEMTQQFQGSARSWTLSMGCHNAW